MFPEWGYLLMGFLIGGGALWLHAKRERNELFQKFEGLQEELIQKKTELAQLSERLAREEQYREKLETEKAELFERLEEAQKELALRQAEIAKLKERITQEEEHFREKLEIIEKAQKELENTFKALSSEIFQKNTENFLKLAQDRLSVFREEIQGQLKAKEEAIDRLTQPIKEALEKVNREIKEMEEKREGAYKSLQESLRNLVEVYLPRLQKETENLSRALRQPRIRGRWGEIQLKRVVEMVGMLPKCDFEEQTSFSTDERTLRPDMIIRLPGGRIIAVDAKVPFEVYIEAIEEENEDEAHKKIQEYVAGLKNHIKSLSQKRYWEAIESRWQKSPEFVILFLPAEGLFSAALKSDPEIVEFGAKHKVLLATPITLIAILKAVAYAWQEQELAENAREIAHLGKQLYERLRVLTEHFNDLGNRLKQAVEAYNKTVRSYESRILVTARKFEDFRMISPEKKIPDLTEISTYPLEK
ncbi:DNA recombination protein RmuC [Thermosulfurimonas dismutans]|uniref:DNA recombination protein RmuC n=1 Tax=Thermosulfurimonas dismutans TaxID=999894 RepID=A0A179D1L6_9BACT|nr:DNA recombination protein RmuC [Thermosulfurimonas dismutans]OAQ19964.1 DNA recombination protein RmuC [Thermosulfurimonas dismutans]